MKKQLLVGAFALFFLSGTSLKAQLTLPYITGFDNASQQNGWQEYKTAATQFSHWGAASANAFSAPNCMNHGYSPSSGITLTDNWFVSPSFSIPNGGQLDSVRYMFSGFSVPQAGDTIALYLLTGSQDPTQASSKTLLFDFRGAEYIADFTYRIKTNISLPASSGASYLAIRYCNADCSSRWLTVHFDNIGISGAGVTGIEDEETTAKHLKVYPNPSSGRFTIQNNGPEKIESMVLYNQLGQRIHIPTITANSQLLEIDLSNQRKGIYFLQLQQGQKVFSQKLTVY
jgi:hypothetical protein